MGSDNTPSETRASSFKYTDATVVIAEGPRVGFVTCRDCGAALLLSEDVDVLKQHTLYCPARPLSSLILRRGEVRRGS